MAKGTIIFVHGTGVRLKNYKRGFSSAKERAAAAGIQATFTECAWGDPLGIEFDGLSLPDPPSAAQLKREEEDFARWSFLFADPLFELDRLTVRDTKQGAASTLPPGKLAPWEKVWNDIAAYKPSTELELLLARGDLERFWKDAWSSIVGAPTVPKLAFERSAHEIPEAAGALARAVVAELHVIATAKGSAGPSRTLREKLVARLIADWDQQVYGLGTVFADLLKRATTRMLRAHRNNLSEAISLPVGDIILYQTHGQKIRHFIRSKIEKATAPVSVVAHSLGGIACVDLLAFPKPPNVARLVTVGSQAPLLYEIGALASVARPNPLPKCFPAWLNVYDRNDFLSYAAARLFKNAQDFEAESGQPFPDSHSAYFTNDDVWTKIRKFGVA
jgi:hypothetical protein